MTKAQKKQAVDSLKLLGQAHDGIKKMIEAGNDKAALDLLSQCQECAIRLGEIIEAVEGENFVTIPLIEEYCELAYQIYEKILNNGRVNASQVNKALRRTLVRVENSVKNEITERMEVVFLPYKASMWDSLESVWKAADEDPNCAAYVVPIPYYDKNPDGSFREEQYEGGEYPAYVPVTR